MASYATGKEEPTNDGVNQLALYMTCGLSMNEA